MQELSIPLSVLALIFAVIAFFYASVGLGGGSSYTALLALAGAGVTIIPIISLTLIVVVISDSTHAGTRKDKSGLVTKEFLQDMPVEIAVYNVLPDDRDIIAARL